MSSPTSFKTEQSPASIYAPSEPQTPDDGLLIAAVAQLSVNDEKAVEVKTDESGSYSMDIAKSENEGYSSGTELYYSPPFVRNGLGSLRDDPFKSTTPPNKYRPGHRTPTAPKASRNAGMMSNDWRSGSGSSDEESVNFTPAIPRSQKQDTVRKLSFNIEGHGSESPNGKFAGFSVVKVENAQSVYHPSCCVFVANLLQSESEETLQMAVTQIFREYGPVYVKIRRDAKQMPFAFCQYTMPEHAELAINEGRGRLIKGRPCRCEKAKAHRLFFVERKYGPIVTPQEVRELLEPFGNIDFCYTASHVERTALNLGDGVIVQFQMYDDGQSAQTALRNHDLWKLVAIAGLASPSRTTTTNRSPPSASDTTRAYLARYEIDRRSIFVGNLPVGSNEAQIKAIFEYCGFIEEIILRESASKYDSQDKFCFAFVEFRSPMAVSNALAAKDGFSIGGKTLRVSQKDSENGGLRRSTRASSQAPIAPAALYQSPASHGVEQQVSPIPLMAPPVYGSPYAYPYSPFYSYAHGSTVYSDGQHYYQSPAYSPAYFSYAGSPSYDNRTPAPAEVPGTPTTHPGYYNYGYPPYQYAPAPYWGMSTASAEQQASALPAAYYPAAYSPQMATSTITDERSTTPTPAEHAPATETPMESE